MKIMKKNVINFIKSIFLLAFLVIGIQSASAQILPPPSPAPSGGGGGGPAAVPLDPVSWVMLAAGGGVAAKKYVDKRRDTKDN